jgi:hypothetical protein
MDCLDCHNRPTHIFRSPSGEPRAGRGLDRHRLSFVKNKAVELLAGEYTSKPEGSPPSRRDCGRSTRRSSPRSPRQRAEVIERAAAEVQDIYRRSSFPSMKVRWDAGHLDSRGCFRCHEADHRSVDDRTLERGCDTCHLVVAQGPPGEVETAVDGLPFHHPVDLGGVDRLMP